MNPFISLLAGVAGAAVYDHLKAKGSMAKKVTLPRVLLARPLNRDGQPSSQYDAFFYYVQETYQPLLDQLESEAQMAAQAGDEGAYYSASLEIDNVQSLMNRLVQGLTSGEDALMNRNIQTALNDIAKGTRPFSGYMN